MWGNLKIMTEAQLLFWPEHHWKYAFPDTFSMGCSTADCI